MNQEQHGSPGRSGLILAVAAGILIAGGGGAFALHQAEAAGAAKIYERMEALRSTYVPGLVAAIWSDDDELVESLLQSVLQLPDVQYVRLEINSEVKSTAGRRIAKEFVNYDLRLNRIQDNRPVQVGTLEIFSSLDAVSARVEGQALTLVGPWLVAGLLAFLAVWFAGRGAAGRPAAPAELPEGPPMVLAADHAALEAERASLERRAGALTEERDDLERQLTARTEDLAVMNMTVQSQVQHLRASERDLREVEAGIVAQLAAPTRALETYGVLLERGVAAPEVVAAWRDETGQAQRRLQRGIDGLLRFTKVTTSGGAFGHVDLNDVIDEALEHLEPQLIEAQAEVDVAELPTVAGDREQLRQVMIQLIANALGHRRDDVRMSIKVSWSAQQWRDVATDNVAPADEFVQIEFEDNGSGFAPEDAERIFGLFTHLVDSGAGEGVGLAYCRRVVERHGGTLSARGRPGQGAHFVMTLPRRLAIARV